MTWSTFNLTPPIGGFDALSSAANVQTLIAHPWMQGVGEGVGHYRYLSFPNAAAALSTELVGETQAVFGMAITAASYADFALQIKGLTDAFPIKQFDQIHKRAAQLVSHEIDKFNLPVAPSLLSGGTLTLGSLPTMAALQKAAIVQQAKAAAQAFEDSNPLDNLTAFQTAKAVADAAVNNALNEAKALFTGGSGWRFYTESDAAASIMNGPGHEHTLTAMMLFIGSPADLSLLREIAP